MHIFTLQLDKSNSLYCHHHQQQVACTITKSSTSSPATAADFQNRIGLLSWFLMYIDLAWFTQRRLTIPRFLAFPRKREKNLRLQLCPFNWKSAVNHNACKWPQHNWSTTAIHVLSCKWIDNYLLCVLWISVAQLVLIRMSYVRSSLRLSLLFIFLLFSVNILQYKKWIFWIK